MIQHAHVQLIQYVILSTAPRLDMMGRFLTTEVFTMDTTNLGISLKKKVLKEMEIEDMCQQHPQKDRQA
mgnify:CR=1 FL=1